MKQDKQPTTSANLRRYSHDLSFQRSWTSSTGHIIPVVHDFLNAGETIQCSIDLKTRMQPIARPAMMDIHQKIKYFFVPMDMLYSLFGSIRYQVNDFFSSRFETSDIDRPDGFPVFDFKGFFEGVYGVDADYSQWSGVNVSDGRSSNYNGFNVFDNFWQGCHRLFDSLGYDANVVFNGVMSDSDIYQPNIFPYALLAYQCIYQNYFRDDEYERFDNSAFNVDSFYQSGFASYPFYQMLTLRYVGRFKNYFTNVHQSPIIGNDVSRGNLLKPVDWSSSLYSESFDVLRKANFFLGDSGDSDASLASENSELVNQDSTTGNIPLTTGYLPQTNSNDGDYQQINASQLRMLFAVDKLMTVTGRARKRVDDQVLAHFGFKVPLDVKHNIQYLGEQDGSFGIGDVVSTSATDDAVLGALAGKAYGVVKGNGVKKFTAPVDGVFIGVYYSMPKVRYAAGFEKKNAVASRTDLYIPEFDSLGMQPMYLYECQSNMQGYSQNLIIGWQWRYEQFKRNFDSVSWAFRKFGNAVNTLNPWSPVMSPLGFSSLPYHTIISLKVTPHDLDNVMVVPFDSSTTSEAAFNPSMFYWTDPFLHDMTVNYKKLSTMSTFSIPSLNGL